MRPPAIVLSLLLCALVPTGAAAQSNRCDSARDVMDNARRRLSVDATETVLQEGLQNLRRATELCPSLGDAYYFMSLVAARLKQQDRAANWRSRAEFHGSGALKSNEPLFLERAAAPAITGAGADTSRTDTTDALPRVPVSPFVQRKFAVVAGISRFKDSRINALKYTTKDAEAIARALKEDCDFDQVTVLLDERATSYNLKTEIDRIARTADVNDLVVIYISSHGSPENLDTAGINYIVTHDTEVSNLYPTAYRMDDLLEDIDVRVKAGRIVAFLDTCYSGGTYRELPPGWTATSRALVVQGGAAISHLQDRLSRGSRNLVVDADKNAAPPGRVAQGVGRVIITSSSQAERSWEDDGIQHGYFTYFVLDALKRPGAVSVDDIFQNLRTKVPEAVQRDKKQPQHPGIARSRDNVNLYLKDKTAGRE